IPEEAPRAQSIPMNQRAARAHGVAFSPNGQTLAVACADHRTLFWDVPSRRLLLALAGHETLVRAVTFSPGGELVATVGDRTTRLWDWPSGSLRGTCNSQAGQARCAAFAGDGSTLAIGSFDHVFAVDLWAPMTVTRRGRLIDPGSGPARERSTPATQPTP